MSLSHSSPKSTLVSVRGQSEKATHGVTPSGWHSGKRKVQRQYKDQQFDVLDANLTLENSQNG
jgi:hypothetical protein